MVGFFVFAAILLLTWWYHSYSIKKTYRMIDQFLDCVLEQEEIPYSQIKEGELSSLVHKIHRIQEVLGKQVEAAEEEKEQVKGLVSNITHQLKTPLANLSLYTQILMCQEADESQKAEICQKIEKQIDKLDWMVNSLTKMVKLEQNVIIFECQDISIKKTILDAIDAIYGKAERKRIDLVAKPFKDCALYHNRKWTAEVFVNLLENAVKYTGDGGTIQIQVFPYEMYTEIQFIDNGRGIPKEEVAQVFKRFYRGKEVENIEGSGIGLYLSNLILEREKGYMTVKSVYGAGSCFSVYLKNAGKGA